MDKCKKCGSLNKPAEKGITFEGLDEHHNPPRYMFDNRNTWNGELYWLCRKHHTGILGIHKTIILPILLNNMTSIRFNGSEEYIWRNLIIPSKKEIIKKEVFESSKKWVNDNGDTKKLT
jgi:hypothetical protein